MADIIAGIAPQIDTHANWTALNPTLGKDSGGKSYGQIILSTASPVGDLIVWGNDQTYSAAYAAGQYYVQPIDTVTVTASATVGGESVVNVNTGTATITIPSALPVGTRKTIRKISSTAGTITIARSSTDVFTRAALTSVTLTSDGDFWVLEKVTATRWELVDGVESGSNVNGQFTKNSDGSLFCRQIKEITHNSSVFDTTFNMPAQSVASFTYNLSGSVSGTQEGKINTIRCGSFTDFSVTTSIIGSVIGTFDSTVVDFIWHINAFGRWYT